MYCKATRVIGRTIYRCGERTVICQKCYPYSVSNFVRRLKYVLGVLEDERNWVS
jgi:hypothetical protein